MSSRFALPATEAASDAHTVAYHQTHTVYGLPACPLCGWRSMIVRSYGRHREGRSYYVVCDHCAEVEGNGSLEGPVCESAELAGKAFNQAMRKYAESFMRGDGGEY
ncbi:hypothetical protein DES53_11558 [Roseimicrobium gellanilyticum]|uniref:Restriction alleviation protein Lar n=1 Tax=Roseimicrobium gellanilyticum TaxID=748857 RepID=A0A366H681_9BACT|nr:hypothetical protein [Roseimicrobium gellanilyticum]RBP36917.1 hypothetical protein DES53_11558 [Roseimicrobium gellanilyticum]